MKIKSLVIAILIVCLSVGLYLGCMPQKNNDLIRIHIRANSFDSEDEQISASVREQIVAYLENKLIKCDNKQQAYKLIQGNLQALQCIANSQIKKYGKSYTARVMLREEELPTRQYLSYTLEQGLYDSLTIELGNASGKEWWCVAFPPICFNDNNDYYYQSRIKKLIEKYL